MAILRPVISSKCVDDDDVLIYFVINISIVSNMLILFGFLMGKKIMRIML